MRLEHLLSGADGYHKVRVKSGEFASALREALRFVPDSLLLYYTLFIKIEKDEAEHGRKTPTA